MAPLSNKDSNMPAVYFSSTSEVTAKSKAAYQCVNVPTECLPNRRLPLSAMTRMGKSWGALLLWFRSVAFLLLLRLLL